MRLSKAWIVANKDFSVFRKIKYVLYSLIAMPVFIGIILPVAFIFALSAQTAAAGSNLSAEVALANQLANIGSVYMVLVPAILPSIIASYSFVGEKIEKSLEPLLATPTTDGELLLGKSLAALIPCLGVSYIGTALYIAIMDGWCYVNLGFLPIPNAYWAVITFAMIPLACVLAVEANVVISAKVNDIRAAQQLGGLVVLPLLFVVIISSTSTALPAVTLGLVVSAALAVADIAFFYLAKATFKREEILTKWK